MAKNKAPKMKALIGDMMNMPMKGKGMMNDMPIKGMPMKPTKKKTKKSSKTK